MGRDIHTFIEYKQPDTDEWIHYDVNSIMNDRNYALFSVLAGVHRYDQYPSICEPRGLPNDVSKYVQDEYNYYGWNSYSGSYFTLAELLEALPNYNDPATDSYNPLTAFVEALQSHADTILKPMSLFHKDPVTHYSDHIRVVFWFDN